MVQEDLAILMDGKFDSFVPVFVLAYIVIKRASSFGVRLDSSALFLNLIRLLFRSLTKYSLLIKLLSIIYVKSLIFFFSSCVYFFMKSFSTLCNVFDITGYYLLRLLMLTR